MMVVLCHETRSVFSWLIARVTKDRWTHAALSFDGDSIIDASESRGSVGRGGLIRDYGHRRIVVIELPDPLGAAHKFALSKMGSKYDWRGVFGWIFHCNDYKRFYCFEYAMTAIYRALGEIYSNPGRTSAQDILDALKAYPVIYEGEAVQYRYESN